MYHSAVRTFPSPPRAGQPAVIRVTVRDARDRAVLDLEPSHERLMHVAIVSRDLRHFAHVHPEPDGTSFRVEHTFAEGGEHLLFADYQQPGRGQVVDRHPIRVEGSVRPAAEPLGVSPPSVRTGGVELKLQVDGELFARQSALLRFDVADAQTGQAVADLEPYLGAKAHFLVLSADGEDFVHAHAIEDADPARLTAHAVFPRPGLYKLWAQLQRRGTVVTVPFVLHIAGERSETSASPDRTPSEEHAHHRH